MADAMAKRERVKIKPKNLPFFKPGKELKDRVDR
jgi:nucleoid DNA-binding protein